MEETTLDTYIEKCPSGYYTIEVKLTDKNDVVYYAEPIYILVGTAERGEVLINSGFDCSASPWSVVYQGERQARSN